MKYYAVIDTNVLVSALLKRNSVPDLIIGLVFNDLIVPVLNKDIEKEYQAVLSRGKFHFPDTLVNGLIDAFRRHGLYVDAAKLDIDMPDPKDRVFYEVVMEERKDEDAYLVTGNIKHFPTKPFIVTPRQMLDIILSDAE